MRKQSTPQLVTIKTKWKHHDGQYTFFTKETFYKFYVDVKYTTFDFKKVFKLTKFDFSFIIEINDWLATYFFLNLKTIYIFLNICERK